MAFFLSSRNFQSSVMGRGMSPKNLVGKVLFERGDTRVDPSIVSPAEVRRPEASEKAVLSTEQEIGERLKRGREKRAAQDEAARQRENLALAKDISFHMAEQAAAELRAEAGIPEPIDVDALVARADSLANPKSVKTETPSKVAAEIDSIVDKIGAGRDLTNVQSEQRAGYVSSRNRTRTGEKPPALPVDPIEELDSSLLEEIDPWTVDNDIKPDLSAFDAGGKNLLDYSQDLHRDVHLQDANAEAKERIARGKAQRAAEVAARAVRLKPVSVEATVSQPPAVEADIDVDALVASADALANPKFVKTETPPEVADQIDSIVSKMGAGRDLTDVKSKTGGPSKKYAIRKGDVAPSPVVATARESAADVAMQLELKNKREATTEGDIDPLLASFDRIAHDEAVKNGAGTDFENARANFVDEPEEEEEDFETVQDSDVVLEDDDAPVAKAKTAEVQPVDDFENYQKNLVDAADLDDEIEMLDDSDVVLEDDDAPVAEAKPVAAPDSREILRRALASDAEVKASEARQVDRALNIDAIDLDDPTQQEEQNAIIAALPKAERREAMNTLLERRRQARVDRIQQKIEDGKFDELSPEDLVTLEQLSKEEKAQGVVDYDTFLEERDNLNAEEDEELVDPEHSVAMHNLNAMRDNAHDPAPVENPALQVTPPQPAGFFRRNLGKLALAFGILGGGAAAVGGMVSKEPARAAGSDGRAVAADVTPGVEAGSVEKLSPSTSSDVRAPEGVTNNGGVDKKDSVRADSDRETPAQAKVVKSAGQKDGTISRGYNSSSARGEVSPETNPAFAIDRTPYDDDTVIKPEFSKGKTKYLAHEDGRDILYKQVGSNVLKIKFENGRPIEALMGSGSSVVDGSYEVKGEVSFDNNGTAFMGGVEKPALENIYNQAVKDYNDLAQL